MAGRKYGQVRLGFWTSPTTRAMTDDGRTLALYLIAGPHTNMAGCFQCPVGYATTDLGWTEQRTKKAWAGLAKLEFATLPDGYGYTIVTRFLVHNPPAGAKQWAAIVATVEGLPHASHHIAQIIKQIDEIGTCPADLRSRIDRVSIPHATPIDIKELELELEQELEPEPEQESIAPRAIASPPPVYTFTNCVGTKGNTFHVTEELHGKLVNAFPGVDIAAEYPKASLWLDNNQTRRKTVQGMPRFLSSSWMTKAHENAARQPSNQGRVGRVAITKDREYKEGYVKL